MLTDEALKERNREKMRKWREANRQRSREIARKSWAKHKDRMNADPEFRARRRAIEQRHRDTNRESRRKSWREHAQKRRTEDHLFDRRRALKANYGITLEQYEEMFALQNGCCVICNQPQKHTRHKYLSVDHDHLTDKIRQLLCHGCNTGIGAFKDDPALLRAAADYIDRHRIRELSAEYRSLKNRP